MRCVARDIYLHSLREYHETPSLMIQTVHRRFATTTIKSHMENSAAEMLAGIAEKNDNHGLLIDLHGFTKQPFFGEFDLILGTGHRKTVGNTDIDHKFASFMAERGYGVYVPSEESVTGELYGATLPRNLIQKMNMRGLSATVGLQIEIARHFRTADATERGKQLSRDLGDFVSNIGTALNSA